MKNTSPRQPGSEFIKYEFRVQRGACLLRKYTRTLEADELFAVWNEIDHLAEEFKNLYARVEVFDEDDRLLISVGTTPSIDKFHKAAFYSRDGEIANFLGCAKPDLFKPVNKGF